MVPVCVQQSWTRHELALRACRPYVVPEVRSHGVGALEGVGQLRQAHLELDGLLAALLIHTKECSTRTDATGMRCWGRTCSSDRGCVGGVVIHYLPPRFA
jgi:hypothetical protein